MGREASAGRHGDIRTGGLLHSGRFSITADSQLKQMGIAPSGVQLVEDNNSSTDLLVSRIIGDGTRPEASDTAGLPTQALISTRAAIEHTTTDTASVSQRPSTPGTNLPSGTREAPALGLDLERRKFCEFGCSSKVIDTLMKARKSSTNATYSKIWWHFEEFAAEHGFSVPNPAVHSKSRNGYGP